MVEGAVKTFSEALLGHMGGGGYMGVATLLLYAMYCYKIIQSLIEQPQLSFNISHTYSCSEHPYQTIYRLTNGREISSAIIGSTVLKL